jgi:hypothetical protein
MAKATIVTLPELVVESQLVIYGRLASTDSSAASAAPVVQFKATRILKGASLIHESTIPLCNWRPNSEWPDVSKIAGESILFVSRKGDCFALSHSYRAIVRIHNGRADTIIIKGQPADQPKDALFKQILALTNGK